MSMLRSGYGAVRNLRCKSGARFPPSTVSLLEQFLLPWLMSADWKYDGGDHNFDRLAAGAGAVN